MKMKKISLALLFLISIIMVSSCCACRKTVKNPFKLDSCEWLLVEMNSKQDLKKGDNNSFTVRFDDVDKKITGMAQCNRFFGGYELLTGGKIKFGNMGATRMMCPDIEIESEFLGTFSEIDSYNIDGDMLLLQKKGEVVMIFQALPETKTDDNTK